MTTCNANATRGSRSNSDVNSDMSMSGAVTGDAAVLLPKVGVASRSAASYDGNEETQQRDRLTGRISVQIIEKTDNGNYRIEGTRRLGINGEENLMTITGVVRPQDVMSNNTIYSYNIADSKITYRRTGLVNKMSSPRTITKLVTFAVVGAAAVFAATNLSF